MKNNSLVLNHLMMLQPDPYKAMADAWGCSREEAKHYFWMTISEGED